MWGGFGLIVDACCISVTPIVAPKRLFYLQSTFYVFTITVNPFETKTGETKIRQSKKMGHFGYK
jgi:hypothetical protein